MLEKGLEELGRSQFWAPNPVSFVAWFLKKPYVLTVAKEGFTTDKSRVAELDDIREVLCLSELSIQDCHPSPKIRHRIQTSDSIGVYEDGGIRPDWRADALGGLLPAPEVGAEHDDENTRGHIHEEPIMNEAQFDNPLNDFSYFLDGEELGMGF